GAVLRPALRTAICSWDFWASRWLSGNVARTTWIGKFPDGSLASWRWLPPHPAAVSASRAAAPVPAASSRVLPRSLTAGRRYHGIRGENAGSRVRARVDGCPGLVRAQPDGCRLSSRGRFAYAYVSVPPSGVAAW